MLSNMQDAAKLSMETSFYMVFYMGYEGYYKQQKQSERLHDTEKGKKTGSP